MKDIPLSIFSAKRLLWLGLMLVLVPGVKAQVDPGVKPASPPPEPRPLETRSLPAIVFTPPERGMPGNREGAGTRGCDQADQDLTLTALLPSNHLGLTAQAQPTFFWAAPAAPEQFLEFNLNDAEENVLYSIRIPGFAQASIGSVTLPQDISLQVDQLYHWYVALICDPQSRSADIVVDGWIKRVELPAHEQILTQMFLPRYRSHYLAESGLWHDALSLLSRGRQDFPELWQQSWFELLEAEDLGSLADLPLQSSEVLAYQPVNSSSF
ncbi:MAG: DUF928 domain-containing protein [Synechococcaceae cyanobacterium SM2_3_1]|nr:DUF928 domain-containing protein [Synechococcaceae cyanobacterium SM2_3_1]